jgi:hypothetical protein
MASLALAGKTNVAVVGADDTEPARTLLTLELGKLPDVQVLERAELDKLAGEFHLQSGGLTAADEIRLGKLLHADALVLLTADTKARSLTMRLMAVAQGVTLSETTHPLPPPEPQRWSSITARKLAPFLAGFTATTAPRVPISILKIRSANGGSKLGTTEKDLAFLLSRRLMNEPSLWVLERSQMGLLDWENSLKANPQAEYWTGGYLLDGTLDSDATGYTVTARLRSAQNGQEITVKAQDKDLLKLVDSLGTQITASLKIQGSPAAWDRSAEARQYYEEALWSVRWRLYAEASQASESAWALGMRSDTLALLRFSSEGFLLRVSAIVGDSKVPQERPASDFDSASTALDRLENALAWKGRDFTSDWVTTAALCLSNCSQVLPGSYYSGDPASHETEVAKSLGRRMLAIAETLEEASARFPFPQPNEKSVGFYVPGSLNETSLYMVRATEGPLWQEDAATSIQSTKALFDEMDAIADPRIRSEVKRKAIFEFRPRFAPWIAYWNPADASRFPLSALKTALLDSPSPERPVDIALIVLERRNHVFLDVYSDHFDPDQTLAAIVDLQTALWNARGALAQKQISIPWVLAVMNSIHEAERNCNEYASPHIDAGLDEFRFELFRALLSEQVADAETLDKLAPFDSRLTEEQKLELAPLIRDALARGKTKNSQFTQYLERIAPTHAAHAPVPPVAPTPNQYLRPAWTVSREQLLNGNTGSFLASRWRNNQFYFAGTNYGPTWRTEAAMLFIFNPKTSVSTKISYPSNRGFFSDIETVGNDVFAAVNGGLARYRTAESRWEDIPGIAADFGKLIAIDGMLYIFGQPGILLRFDPATGKADVLASSRSRPAQTILDDVPPYEIHQVFKDRENRLCILLGNGKIDRFDETKRDWEQILDVVSNPEKVDLDLIYRAIGREGFFPFPAGSPMNVQSVLIGLALQNKMGPTNKLPPAFAGHMMNLPPAVRAVNLGMRYQGSSAAYDGSNLWLITFDPQRRVPLLRCIPTSDEPEQAAPISNRRTRFFPNGNSNGRRPRRCGDLWGARRDLLSARRSPALGSVPSSKKGSLSVFVA